MSVDCCALDPELPYPSTMMHADLIRPSASSFPLQLLLILAIFSVPVWFIITVALLIFKAVTLPYPPLALGFEFTATVLIYIVQYFGVTLGKRGNLMESTGTLMSGIVLLIFACVGTIYFMWFQVYVLMLDVIVSATFLTVDGFAVLLGLYAFQAIGAAGALPVQSRPKQE